jgi:ABC-type Fe3+-hydroxamate transport system substrate-binding protein
VKDWAGITHERSDGAPRIACLVPSITELLFDLGLGANVVARTGFCIHPAPQVLQVPKVGGTKDVNLKKLAALSPTHVIVNIDENRRETFDALQQFVPHIVVTHPCTPQDNHRLYRLLGHLFGCELRAETLCQQLQIAITDAQKICAAMPRERVLYLIWRDPWMTVGPETYIAKTLALTGWECLQPASSDNQIPAAQILRYPTLGNDDTVWHQADHILLSTEPYAFSEQDRAILQATVAPHANVRLIDGEMVSWYGSRAIAGLHYLANFRSK